MDDIVKACDLLLLELYKFDDSMTSLGPQINDNRMEVFEENIGFKLPLDFKYIIKKHNGISLSGTEIYGLDDALRGSSLDEVYQYERSMEIYNPMPREFLPFSPDGRGNHYCLNLSKLLGDICPVVFWQHDLIYNNVEEVEECNGSLMSWIQEVMIDWTLEDYDYDGTEK